jgi:hypothetical protein
VDTEEEKEEARSMKKYERKVSSSVGTAGSFFGGLGEACIT